MISLLLCSFLSTAQAVPMQLSQQGRLVDSSGAAAAGNHNLTFRLYNASTGGTLLWNETVSTNFTNGYYSVVLGSDTINNPLEDSVLESGDLFIEIEIDSDGPLTPRSAVTSTPFARVAGKAQSADWGGLTSIPSDIDDGDDDTVGALSCSVGEQPVYNGSGVWECGNPVDDVDADNRLAALETLIATLQSDLATTQSDLATTQSDLAAAQGDLTTANSTISSLQSSVGTNTTDISSNSSDITGLDTDLTTAEGNITSLQASVTTNTTDIAALQSDVTTLQGSVLDLIDTDTTWNIGNNGDYSTLEDAMAAAKSVRVHPDAMLTLQLENNIYTVSDEINLNHPDGSNIVIQGNSADPALVQLEFAGTNGFYIDSGHVFGGLNHLTIRGNSSGSRGIDMWYGATVHATDIVVEDFNEGARVLYGSILHLMGENYFQSNDDDGLEVQYNSIVRSDDIVHAINNTDKGMQLSYNASAFVRDSYFDNNNYGIYTFHNAAIDAEGSNFSNNTKEGAYLAWNTSGHLQYATVQYNGEDGLNVNHSSSVYANNADTSYNNYTGVVVYNNSQLSMSSSNSSNNTIYDGFIAGRESVLEVHNSTANNNNRYGISIRPESFFYEYNNTATGNGSGSTQYYSDAYIE